MCNLNFVKHVLIFVLAGLDIFKIFCIFLVCKRVLATPLPMSQPALSIFERCLDSNSRAAVASRRAINLAMHLSTLVKSGEKRNITY